MEIEIAVVAREEVAVGTVVAEGRVVETWEEGIAVGIVAASAAAVDTASELATAAEAWSCRAPAVGIATDRGLAAGWLRPKVAASAVDHYYWCSLSCCRRPAKS